MGRSAARICGAQKWRQGDRGGADRLCAGEAGAFQGPAFGDVSAGAAQDGDGEGAEICAAGTAEPGQAIAVALPDTQLHFRRTDYETDVERIVGGVPEWPEHRRR